MNSNTRSVMFYIIDIHGDHRRFLKAIDGRPGLAGNEKVIATSCPSIAESFEFKDVANNTLDHIRRDYPRAVVRQVVATYSIA